MSQGLNKDDKSVQAAIESGQMMELDLHCSTYEATEQHI